MDRMRQGWLTRSFQAAQQGATTSSQPSKTRFESELWRVNCQRFSTGLSVGERGGNSDVVRHDEGAGEVPARLAEDEGGVGVRRHRGTDFREVLLHRRRIAERHDEAGALARGRADRAEM